MTRLEFLRRKQGLSQEGLGGVILYSRHTVQLVESGKLAAANVNRRLRKALEDHFGESLESLTQEV